MIIYNQNKKCSHDEKISIKSIRLANHRSFTIEPLKPTYNPRLAFGDGKPELRLIEEPPNFRPLIMIPRRQ